MRRSEVVLLKKFNIFEKHSHFVLLVTGKGKKEEYVKLQPVTQRAIFKYCNQHKSDYVFINRYGNQLSSQAIWRIVEKYIKKAGIKKKITPHSLRHTFVTLSIDGGAPLQKVQAAARHADIKTTIRYYRNKHDLDDNAVDYIHLES